jgi:uncharacterized membrane protein (UPF0127 family)
MLFKFPRLAELSFWMRNTYIPLDIAFVDEDGTILQISEMSPLSQRQIKSRDACRYAIEVNHGWFAKNNIKPGARVKGLCFAQTMMPQQTEDPNQVSPEVMVNFNLRDKLQYAQDRGLALRIIYRSKEGHVLPPRTLYPVEEEGDIYPISSGPHGDFFKAYDASPAVSGGTFDIPGGQVKSFLFDGVIKLDIIGMDGGTIEMIRGVPVAEPPVSPEEIYDFDVRSETSVYQTLKQQIPELTVEVWEEIKDDVKGMLQENADLETIVDNVLRLMMEKGF